MPHYDYYCTSCGYKEEILQKITEEPLKECPQCQQPTFKRKFGMGIGLHFQGTGFYCTDYNQSSTSPPVPEKESGSSPSDSSSPSPTPPPSSSSEDCECRKSSCS